MTTGGEKLSDVHGYEHGLALLQAGQVEEACDVFCDVLDAYPATLDDIVAAFGGRSERERAVATLKRQVESGSVRSASRCALAARLARELGFLENARRWAELAVETDPTCAPWWLELAEVRLAGGDAAGAAAAYRRCLAIEPRQMLARTRLAACKCRRWGWMARLLGRSRAVHRVLRCVVWLDGTLEILGEGSNSAAVHQARWVRSLELGSALWLFPDTPEGREPENFAEHWEECKCNEWRWFLAQGVENEIRTVLDVGCGTGYTTEHFVRRGFDVTGVTCNPHEKRECLRRGIKVLEEDFHFLSVQDGSYDLVFSCHSLEHSISPLFALWEWKRVVRPGGYLMIILPMAIDRDVRAAFPDHYDRVSESMDFHITDGDTLTSESVQTAFYTYASGGGHVIVPTYWQLVWLFRVAGLELLADAAGDPITGELLGVEHVDGRLTRDPLRTLNGFFLLRKPTWETVNGQRTTDNLKLKTQNSKLRTQNPQSAIQRARHNDD